MTKTPQISATTSDAEITEANPFSHMSDCIGDCHDYPIQVGDKLYVSNGDCDIEGCSMTAVCDPYDSILAIREDDGTELKVKGWLADTIEINGVVY